nr:uncharacterized protein LOC111427546 [Onthophagus taurus]
MYPSPQPQSLKPLYLISFILLYPQLKAEEISTESFKHCLISKPNESFGYCLGVGALTKLQTLENNLEFEVTEDLKFTKDDQQYREAYNFVDSNPGSFRSILDTVDNVFSRRKLLWDMSFLYPGLSMRVSPSLNPMGALEFALDQHRDSLVRQNLKDVGTGRVLARQFLVPLLLGLKLNVATLLPIFLGILAFMVKKAVIFSKLALIISSAYALSNLVFNSGGNYAHSQHHHQEFPGHNFYNIYKNEEINPNIYNVNEYADLLRLRGQIPVEEIYAREKTDEKGRNFAWTNEEHKNVA